ncbi:hypothetical protein CHU98_g2762 [Xylaria longipes]|nr:hypothetical protein CHU98_g2762 [Xylaria longipes]
MTHTGDAEGREETGDAVEPVADGEEARLGVEGQVRVGALGVVVGRRQTGAGGVEGTAADHGGDARAGAGEGGLGRHLGWPISFLKLWDGGKSRGRYRFNC